MPTFFTPDFTGTHETSKDAIATFSDEGVTNAHIHRLRTNYLVFMIQEDKIDILTFDFDYGMLRKSTYYWNSKLKQGGCFF